MPNLSLLAWGFVVLGILGTLSGVAYRIRESGADSVHLEWERAKRGQREKEARRGQDAAEKKEKGDQKARVVYRALTVEVERVVEKPIYKHVCFDDDGLSIARAAIRGEIPDSSKPDKPVSAPARTGKRDGGISLAMDRLGF
jgi:hypothetical protein